MSQRAFPHHSMSDITVTLPDGSSRVVPAGTTPADIAASISAGLARAALAAFVDDRMVDLSYPPRRRMPRVRIVTTTSPEALALYRHSTAHLMAAAVTNLFPGTQCGIGPGDRGRLLLRLRRRASVRAGGPRARSKRR